MILLIMIVFPAFLGGLIFLLPKESGKFKNLLLLCGFSKSCV